MTRHSAALSAG